MTKSDDKVFRRQGFQRLNLFVLELKLAEDCHHLELESEAHLLIFYFVLAF